jgi:hypothetical protein
VKCGRDDAVLRACDKDGQIDARFAGRNPLAGLRDDTSGEQGNLNDLVDHVGSVRELEAQIRIAMGPLNAMA